MQIKPSMYWCLPGHNTSFKLWSRNCNTTAQERPYMYSVRPQRIDYLVFGINASYKQMSNICTFILAPTSDHLILYNHDDWHYGWILAFSGSITSIENFWCIKIIIIIIIQPILSTLLTFKALPTVSNKSFYKVLNEHHLALDDNNAI